MFVAIDTDQEVAVTGSEVEIETRSESLKTDGGVAYRCLCCGRPLTYNESSLEQPFEYFTHRHGDGECISDGGMSPPHRLGEECIAKTLFNELSAGNELTQIDLERWVGVAEDFIIADIRVAEPIQLAVEVVFLTSDLDLRRWFQTLFTRGYGGMIVVVTGGELSRERIQRNLNKVGDVRIGMFDPQTLTLELGSSITPHHLDLNTPVWNRLPAYLS
jgi:hypothetical protein